MSRTFFDSVGFIDSVLASSSTTAEKFDRIQPLLEDPDVARAFWDRLNDPEWIGVLAKARLFERSPTSTVTPTGGMRFPRWPASRYLMRVAKGAPALVSSTLSTIHTDNPYVVADLVDAALLMPPHDAASLVPVLQRHAKAGLLWVAFKDTTDLCIALTKSGYIAPALSLAEALFAPRFEPGTEEPTRRDDHWYHQGLTQATPVLAQAAPREYLALISKWLDSSVRAKSYASPDTGEDLSYSWRPAIEEHEQNHGADFASTMVGIVRLGFDTAIDGGHLSLHEALTILDTFKYLVYRRLGVYLIGKHADQDPPLARATILQRELFDDYRLKHEYATLVEQRFPMLSASEQEEWYAWLDTGPDMSDFDEFFKKNIGRDASVADRTGRIEYWQFERLHWVRSTLTGHRRQFYERMLTEHGRPALADLNARITTSWGNPSPIPPETLQGHTLPEVIRVIRKWRPESKASRSDSSIEGLASAFSKYLSTDVERLSSEAPLLAETPAIFVRTFISHMREGIEKNVSVDVPAVLRLCDWVIRQPVEQRTTPPESHGFVDRDWQWTRDAIAGFCEAVCKARDGDRPRFDEGSLRAAMWDILAQLCQAPVTSRSKESEGEGDPRLRDYLDRGINSSRGRAVGAALEYGRWRGNHLKRNEGGREVIPGGFRSMPEVREMLEWQIQRQNRTVEAMSVIGSHTGLIYWLDRAWLAANAAGLFDLDAVDTAAGAAEGWAGWNSFLVWVPPHIEFYKIFKKQFERAVDQATQLKESPQQSRMQPMQHLGEHLMLLYGRGQLSLNDAESLVQRFIHSAQADLRRYAIGFVGRTLAGKEELPGEVMDRFRALWELYWNDHGKADAAEKPNAYLFGPWFVSGRFPATWALGQLREFAQVVGMPEPDDAILEQLVSVAPADLDAALAVLGSMIYGDKDGWHVSGWIDTARALLELGIRAGGGTSERSIELINELGRRGHMSLGELLSR